MSNSKDCLQATELRLAGNGEARNGNLEKAARLYTSALELDPPHGRHLLLSNRSGVLLSLGKAVEAARDADEAADSAPEGFRNAFIRQVLDHDRLQIPQKPKRETAPALTCTALNCMTARRQDILEAMR